MRPRRRNYSLPGINSMEDYDVLGVRNVFDVETVMERFEELDGNGNNFLNAGINYNDDGSRGDNISFDTLKTSLPYDEVQYLINYQIDRFLLIDGLYCILLNNKIIIFY